MDRSRISRSPFAETGMEMAVAVDARGVAIDRTGLRTEIDWEAITSFEEDDRCFLLLRGNRFFAPWIPIRAFSSEFERDLYREHITSQMEAARTQSDARAGPA